MRRRFPTDPGLILSGLFVSNGARSAEQPSHVAVDVAPVGDDQHQHLGLVVVDLVHDAQVADADAVTVVVSRQLLAAGWARTVGQFINPRDARAVRRGTGLRSIWIALKLNGHRSQ